ncbi:MAG: MBOAT family O-acyltransferase [Saccharofermentanales bacterium]
MLFSSVSFLYFFLPVVITVYFIVPQKMRNLFLLIASMFFYFYGESGYMPVMVATILSGYVHGLLIGKATGPAARRFWMISSVVWCGAGLLVFKYADFLILNVNRTGLDIPLLKLGLPLGISFYTFQIISYTIDVYRGKTLPQRNLVDFATYVTFFPQLIAGPIVRYTTIAEQLKTRTHSFADFSYGVRRLVIGLSKKILVANALANFAVSFRASDQKSVLFYWLYFLALTLQLYFDFSAYSDMAIGMGRIFGFHLLENFNYPLTARSITEFWHRWHISLGTWLRDYIYIPMGGNRVRLPRWVFNILIVWLFTGLWHGAGWNFVLWGGYFAVILMMEKLVLSRLLLHIPSALSRLYFILLIIPSFVFFDSLTMSDLAINFKAMTGFADLPLVNADTFYYLRSYFVVFLIAIVGATSLPSLAIQRLRDSRHLLCIINTAEPVCLAMLLLSATAFLVDGSFNPFLYFRF